MNEIVKIFHLARVGEGPWRKKPVFLRIRHGIKSVVGKETENSRAMVINHI